MNADRVGRGGRLLLAKWVTASLAGWALGLMLGLLLTAGGARLGLNEDRAVVPVTLVAIGLACGLIQSWALREALPGAARWLGATVGGHLLAALLVILGNWAGLMSSGILSLLLIGAAIGLPQWGGCCGDSTGKRNGGWRPPPQAISASSGC